ncbi:bifunctional riboflavin biosynthesis protein RIBA 1, chloroplastic [Rhodamnia argentea]|uniref:Bifunctional riboflavin biosynthesis protein RIBA 1, chloroplastic n=1 Tax=Rhodamnia argentea TaxID=178133 RepID=A0A8B8NYI3_9MYRT|nr:bifunctional riboflavin biosynthesis protein RIBA 1, chloroplastic [Rhodamnia argentea]
MASLGLRHSYSSVFSSSEQHSCKHGVSTSTSYLSKSGVFFRIPSKPCRSRAIRKVTFAVLYGEDDLLPYSYNNGATSGQNVILDEQVLPKRVHVNSNGVAFGTLAAEITPTTQDFFPNEDVYDLDVPTEGFSSIPEAFEDIRQGKFVIVVDDEDRENEGDLIMAASLVTPEAMAFIVKHGTGIVCVSMREEDLERLQLPLMVTRKENEEKLCTAFTISVDARRGTTTGVSAHDRARTILSLASKDSKPEDFNRPGHVFPLKYREGGVLKRAGHTEASLDLAMLAGLEPIGVLCEIVDDDGSMARLPKLRQFALKENLKIISIADLIRYRRKRDKLVEQAGVAPIPTMWGPFMAFCYRSLLDGVEHIAMVKGEIGDGHNILVRVHSECLTGDIFGSARCDCGNQLALAMKQIEAAGRGVLVYLRGHEGRGIGLGHKLRAYNLQDDGRDTVEANEELGLPVDSREYGIGAQILRDIGVHTMRLMTNNPAKYVGLKGYGLAIVGRVPLLTPLTMENRRYLETKRAKMGHVYGHEDSDSTADNSSET